MIQIPNLKIITNLKNELLGEVSWYWKSQETNWLEIGIVIFDEKKWGKGIGIQALKLWVSEIFESKDEIVRLGKILVPALLETCKNKLTSASRKR